LVPVLRHQSATRSDLQIINPLGLATKRVVAVEKRSAPGELCRKLKQQRGICDQDVEDYPHYAMTSSNG
jgi:hypothetical protein